MTSEMHLGMAEELGTVHIYMEWNNLKDAGGQ
jgi:hypothetical protein